MAATDYDPNPALQALLTDDLLFRVAETLNDTVGVIPQSRRDLIAVLETDASVVFDAAQWGPWDTEVRGRLSDLVVRYLKIAARWPEYRDNIDIDIFDAKVQAAAKEAGWYIVEESGRWTGF